MKSADASSTDSGREIEGRAIRLEQASSSAGNAVRRLKSDALARLLSVRAVRFVLVGGINTAFSYGIYAALVYAGLNYAIANLASLIAGILFSFKTQGTMVFGNTAHSRFPRFVILWACIYLANIGIIKGLLSIGVNEYQAGAIAIIPVAALSYLGQKHVVFR